MDKITKRLVVVLISLIILLVGYGRDIFVIKIKGNAKNESESTEQNTIAIDQKKIMMKKMR